MIFTDAVVQGRGNRGGGQWGQLPPTWKLWDCGCAPVVVCCCSRRYLPHAVMHAFLSVSEHHPADDRGLRRLPARAGPGRPHAATGALRPQRLRQHAARAAGLRARRRPRARLVARKNLVRDAV